MKKIVVLLVSMFAVACASNGGSKSHSTSKGNTLFKFAMETGCNIKYENSEKECACQADLLHKVTPVDIQRNFTTDPTAKLKLLAVMIENSAELEKCGLNKATNKKPSLKDSVNDKGKSSLCYSDEVKPVYYLSSSNKHKLVLKPELHKALDGVDKSVSREALKEAYFADVKKEMQSMGKLMAKALGKNDSNGTDLNVSSIFDETVEITMQCTDEALGRFYTEEEILALYKLSYIGYANDEAVETILKNSLEQRDISLDTIKQQQEFKGYLKCEIKHCVDSLTSKKQS